MSACNDARALAGVADQREVGDVGEASFERAQANLALLFDHVMGLYTCGDRSSVSVAEAHDLMSSILYVMGVRDLQSPHAVCALSQDDVVACFRERCDDLRKRADGVMVLQHQVVRTLPPLHNISLRDTLLSLGSFKQRYDVLFAAHEVPCSIDYQLSCPVSDNLQGVDYAQAWLTQALREAEYLAQFDLDEMVRILRETCPDYVGLHVNLYDLVHRVKG